MDYTIPRRTGVFISHFFVFRFFFSQQNDHFYPHLYFSKAGRLGAIGMKRIFYSSTELRPSVILPCFVLSSTHAERLLLLRSRRTYCKHNRCPPTPRFVFRMYLSTELRSVLQQHYHCCPTSSLFEYVNFPSGAEGCFVTPTRVLRNECLRAAECRLIGKKRNVWHNTVITQLFVMETCNQF